MQFRAFVHPGKILLENGLVGACPTAVHSTFVCREGIDVKFRKNQDIKKTVAILDKSPGIETSSLPILPSQEDEAWRFH